MSGALAVNFEVVDDKAAVHADVIGAGSFEVLEEGLRIRGRQGLRRLATGLAVVVALVGMIGTVVLLQAFDHEDFLEGKGYALVAIVCGLFPGIIAHQYLVERLRGGPVDVVVPWSRLKVVEAAHGLIRLRFGIDELAGDIRARIPDAAQLQAVVATLSRASG